MLTEQPRKGDRVAWRMEPSGPLKHHGTVLRVEGNMCWYQPDSGEANPFIWRFHDGLNKMVEVIA